MRRIRKEEEKTLKDEEFKDVSNGVLKITERINLSNEQKKDEEEWKTMGWSCQMTVGNKTMGSLSRSLSRCKS